ncbi:alkaline phosphatase [Plasmodium brasilianum]|uniref:Alkaline phosphatase, putative n=2 Tax=Plasmodium (Plasmodium) TaxID=418103 RepID=A0A1A8VT59_PLAMA|nr:alkaline phosphatase, putative [Plasmodium malariae]KAI4839362.1 alkaline phosphatase [Plasmodium brasilianum]SBS83713.1 alkaline phosphatase, putative [Plasmodium malariae]SBT87778.1 alkaline phosphatase, putative [Plasmodium malariae]
MKICIKLFLVFFAFTKCVSGQADQIIHEKLTNFVFLSCNYQKGKVNEELLKAVEKRNPQLMLWIGDYFYSECSELKCLDEVYNYIKNDSFYLRLKEKFVIDGIYDDHDYNKNNGDRLYKYKKESKTKYLDYLNVDKSDIRYKRNGAYVSKLYIDPNDENNQVKIIILDTRYNKDPYPFYAPDSYKDHIIHIFISFFVRFHAALFGLYHNSKNDILGNEQWKWLEKELTNSKARAHIVISSIQIFSNHVMNENWGLMPFALKRLKSVIKKTKPKGLIFLSGDVHFASIIGNEENIVEVTSSSVNQENLLSYVNKYFIYLSTNIFNKRSSFELNKIYGFNNFGSVNINYKNENEINIKTCVHDSHGVEVLIANQVFNKKKNIYEKSKNLHVINDEFATFTYKTQAKICMHIIIYILLLLWFLQVLFIICKLLGLCKSKKVNKKTKEA